MKNIYLALAFLATAVTALAGGAPARCGADFTLYEDDGLTYAYEKGEYSTIPMKWDDKARTLTIGARNGAFKGMKETRRITASLNMPEGTHDILAQVEYDGNETVIRF